MARYLLERDLFAFETRTLAALLTGDPCLAPISRAEGMVRVAWSRGDAAAARRA